MVVLIHLLLGLVVGSFLNVVIYRLPRAQELAMALDELIRAAIFEHRWRSRRWQNKGFTR